MTRCSRRGSRSWSRNNSAGPRKRRKCSSTRASSGRALRRRSAPVFWSNTRFGVAWFTASSESEAAESEEPEEVVFIAAREESKRRTTNAKAVGMTSDKAIPTRFIITQSACFQAHKQGSAAHATTSILTCRFGARYRINSYCNCSKGPSATTLARSKGRASSTRLTSSTETSSSNFKLSSDDFSSAR